MKFYKMTYSNGYVGCDDEEYIRAEDREEAESIAEDGLHDYGESYEHCAEGNDFSEGWEDEESEETYYENLSWSLEEVTKEVYREETGIYEKYDDDEDDE